MFTVSEENTVKCLEGSSDIFGNSRTSHFLFRNLRHSSGIFGSLRKSSEIIQNCRKMTKNPIRYVTLLLEMGASQLCSTVTGVVSKSPFLCVNRRPMQYAFCACTKGLRYRVNLWLKDSDTLGYGLSLLKSKYWWFVYSQLWLYSQTGWFY